MNENKKQYILYFDLLNIAACLCVIFMHCNGAVHTFSNTRLWKESLIVETLAYWAVPIFFMLSGATLFNYRDKYSTEVYFKKRIVKTFVPYILWNLIRILEEVLKGNMDLASLNLFEVVRIILTNGMENVYWFFIPLFMVYLSIPVLSCLRENRKMLFYMAFVGLMTYSILPFIFSLINMPYNSSLYFPITGGYIIFAVLGYLLSTAHFKAIYRYVIYGLGIAGIIIRYGMTYVLSIQHNELNKVSWGYLNIPSVMLAVAVFTFFDMQIGKLY